MKKSLRGRTRHFLTSEEEQVAVKSPVVVGVMPCSILLASTLIGATPAAAWWKECQKDEDCRFDQGCAFHTCRNW